MEEKIKAIEYNLRTLLKRVEQVNNLSKVDYRLIQFIEQISNKIYEVSEFLEEVEEVVNE